MPFYANCDLGTVTKPLVANSSIISPKSCLDHKKTYPSHISDLFKANAYIFSNDSNRKRFLENVGCL